VETREGIYETARTAAQALRDPQIMAWVTPHRALPEFDPRTFPTSTDTVYAMSKDSGGSAAPLVAALVDALFRAGQVAAEAAAGRLDPPMVVVLDEAANVAKIADLPKLYSHLGSRGIVPVTILQSYRQGVGVWGETGMDTLWGAATVKMIGAGIDDPKLAEDLSRLIGDHDVTVRSASHGRDSSQQLSLRRQRILPPEAIRALPRGQGLLLATGTKPALVTLLPWYAGTHAAVITTATKNAEQAITARARQETP
jgi:type IV secretory pathway TraG/TraD family ATPase VirD4